MNQVLIHQYLNDLSDLRRASGTGREGVVSEAFKDLLKEYAKSHDLIFIPQYELPLTVPCWLVRVSEPPSPCC
jgi:hypothetical protein